MSPHQFRVERPIRHTKGAPDGRVPALRQLLEAGHPKPRPQFVRRPLVVLRVWLRRWKLA